MRAIVIIFICLVLAPTVGAQTADSTLSDIIDKVDKLYRSESSHGTMEMEIVTQHWQRTLTMEVWTSGLEKTLVRIHEPKKEEGVGTLRLEDQMWNYLPKTNKVIKIPPSMMMSSWMGSDFTNDDLVKEFSLFEDYTSSWADVKDPSDTLYYIQLTPRPDLPIVWGKIIITARQSDYLPVTQEYYDEKGRLMRVMTYSDIQMMDDRRIPTTMTMVPQDEEGNKTILRYEQIEFNVDLPGDLFSLRNLRSYP
ncbi:outer membrane lipoprotein-sorting protein [candidate division GN15 bacterium]|nr:outer membrane lipoprotein-sorting protein [candidate division GN15 bacterium]